MTATFGQIKDGSFVLSNGFTLTGTFGANYNNQTDFVTWNSVSVSDTAFGPGGVPGVTFIPMQDGGAPGGLDLAFADGANTVNLFILDGADWNVVTDISANLQVAAVPEPSTWAMMLLGFCGISFMTIRRRREGRAFRLA